MKKMINVEGERNSEWIKEAKKIRRRAEKISEDVLKSGVAFTEEQITKMTR